MEENRAFENIEKWLPVSWEVEGKYDTPIIRPVFEIPPMDRFDRFCDILRKGVTKSVGVQFFIQDYQFQRVWFKPDTYVPLLKNAGVVCSPDFSLYTDMPVVMSMYNHYRKHWCGAYWQRHDVTVIPTIAWSDEASYDWCFDGEPVGGVVAVSSAGTVVNYGDSTSATYKKNVEEIKRFDMNEQERKNAYKTLHALTENQLMAEAKSVGPYTSGPARLNTGKVRKNADSAVSARRKTSDYMDSLRKADQRKKSSSSAKSLTDAVMSAVSNGKMEFTFNGATYRRKNSRSKTFTKVR